MGMIHSFLSSDKFNLEKSTDFKKSIILLVLVLLRSKLIINLLYEGVQFNIPDKFPSELCFLT